MCATRRFVVSPVQPGGTRRNVPGSDGLPGSERVRGQEHARKAAAGPGVQGGVPGDPRDMAKAGLPEAQSPEGAKCAPAGKTPETGAAPCAGMNLRSGATSGARSDAQ